MVFWRGVGIGLEGSCQLSATDSYDCDSDSESAMSLCLDKVVSILLTWRQGLELSIAVPFTAPILLRNSGEVFWD
ncbi:hypothetical protein VTL71DRAFT_6566 [Oculimacula yallundae]|uniref:Uncharacterized protein n=1 Tax=Oculimacula yallundae TaxID=86028 RepID=A0ABR4BXF0_9HELO